MEQSVTVQIVLYVVTAAITLLSKVTYDAIKNWRKGRITEAQKYAKERDAALAKLNDCKESKEQMEVDHHNAMKALRKEKRRWVYAYDWLRARVLTLGLTEEQLNKIPKPPDHG